MEQPIIQASAHARMVVQLSEHKLISKKAKSVSLLTDLWLWMGGGRRKYHYRFKVKANLALTTPHDFKLYGVYRDQWTGINYIVVDTDSDQTWIVDSEPVYELPAITSVWYYLYTVQPNDWDGIS